MSKRWKGFRRLAFGGRVYQWKCQFHGSWEKSSVAYAEKGHTWPPDEMLVYTDPFVPGQKLRVFWPACQGPAVTPAVVRELIEHALRHGWLTKNVEWEIKGQQ